MILVTGASGNVGRPLVTSLAGAGHAVRAVSRDPGRARLGPGVEVVEGDPGRPVPALFDGVSAVFVNPVAVGAGVGEFLDLARAAGVRRAVGLSAINVEDDPGRQPSRALGQRNREVEAAVRGWGGEWVSLRPEVYMPNTARMWADQVRAGDVVHGPYAAASFAMIDPRDIAAVAAVALDADHPGSAALLGRCLALTGPEALDQSGALARVAAVTGRALHYAELDPQAARDLFARRGMPPALTEAYLAFHAAAARRTATVTGQVPAVLGRPAIDYTRWVRDNLALFTRQEVLR